MGKVHVVFHFRFSQVDPAEANGPQMSMLSWEGFVVDSAMTYFLFVVNDDVLAITDVLAGSVGYYKLEK